MLSTTKECFEFIAKNWTKEMYKKDDLRKYKKGISTLRRKSKNYKN